MRLGQGYNAVTKRFTNTRLTGVDDHEQSPNSEASQHYFMLKSLSDLYQVLESFPELSEKLPQLHISLDVEPGKPNIWDSQKEYLLIIFRQNQYAQYCNDSKIDFPPETQQSLGLQSEDIVSARDKIKHLQSKISEQEATVKQTQDLSNAAKNAHKEKIKIESLATERLKLAEDLHSKSLTENTTDHEIDQAALNELLKDTKRIKYNAELDTRESIIASEKIQEDLRNQTEDLNSLESELLETKSTLTQLANTLDDSFQETLDQESKIKVASKKSTDFYTEHGTHYVKGLIYGKQLIAIIGMNKEKNSEKLALDTLEKMLSHFSFSEPESPSKKSKNKQSLLETFLEDLENSETVTFQCITDGMPSQSFTIKKLFTLIKQFFDKDENTPSPIKIILNPYDTIFAKNNLYQIKTILSYSANHTLKRLEKLFLHVFEQYSKICAHQHFLIATQLTGKQNPFHEDKDQDPFHADEGLALESPHNERIRKLYKKVTQALNWLNKFITLLNEGNNTTNHYYFHPKSIKKLEEKIEAITAFFGRIATEISTRGANQLLLSLKPSYKKCIYSMLYPRMVGLFYCSLELPKNAAYLIFNLNFQGRRGSFSTTSYSQRKELYEESINTDLGQDIEFPNRADTIDTLTENLAILSTTENSYSIQQKADAQLYLTNKDSCKFFLVFHFFPKFFLPVAIATMGMGSVKRRAKILPSEDNLEQQSIPLPKKFRGKTVPCQIRVFHSNKYWERHTPTLHLFTAPKKLSAQENQSTLPKYRSNSSFMTPNHPQQENQSSQNVREKTLRETSLQSAATISAETISAATILEEILPSINNEIANTRATSFPEEDPAAYAHETFYTSIFGCANPENKQKPTVRHNDRGPSPTKEVTM